MVEQLQGRRSEQSGWALLQAKAGGGTRTTIPRVGDTTAQGGDGDAGSQGVQTRAIKVCSRSRSRCEDARKHGVQMRAIKVWWSNGRGDGASSLIGRYSKQRPVATEREFHWTLLLCR